MAETSHHRQAHCLALNMHRLLVGELPETVQSAKDKAAGLCFEVAEYHRMQRKTDKVGW